MTTNVLADTGAAPSIITTELLAQLPKECVRERNERLQPFRVNGANGQPLCQRGTVALALYLGRMACEQTFIVVEGAPNLIAGANLQSVDDIVDSVWSHNLCFARLFPPETEVSTARSTKI